jgi:2,4-dienoyl-CoA reductase-like NADH-dependent reductase (Old Yellow Enzyme family)
VSSFDRFGFDDSDHSILKIKEDIMAALFEEARINTLTLKNRLVRSATWEGMCDQSGRPSEKLAAYYGDLARGGVGLIISGYTYVRPEGKQLPGKMGIHTDDFQADFENLTRAVHQSGGKIAIQLVHAGGQTSSKTTGAKPLAPSSVHTAQFPEIPSELTKHQITEVIDAFGKAAARAKAWGFDAVQMHGAHGYLINQFLSPLTNRRSDEYGGAADNRCRFMLEVFSKVREAVGTDYPVFIKLNGSDNLDGGLTPEHAVIAAKKLSEAGIDAVEVSSGTGASKAKSPVRTQIDAPEKEAYNLELAMRIKEHVNCPVMSVGGFRSFDIAENAVRNHGIDFIAISRPLIREPNLPERWLKGDRTPAACISCNRCFKPGAEEGGIYCVAEKMGK